MISSVQQNSSFIETTSTNLQESSEQSTSYQEVEDLYKVDFQYYHKPENSQPITTKSMQEMYQGLEDRARETYFKIHKAEEYTQQYNEIRDNPDTTKEDLNTLYTQHIQEMNSPLISLLSETSETSETLETNKNIVNENIIQESSEQSTSYQEVEDLYKVDFQYYHKPENSQPITTKSMQEMYQGLEDRARETYFKIHKAEEYTQQYNEVRDNPDTTKEDLNTLYTQHIQEMNSPLETLLNLDNTEE